MIYIGLDDTDIVDWERGTGKLARQMGEDLGRFGRRLRHLAPPASERSPRAHDQAQ